VSTWHLVKYPFLASHFVNWPLGQLPILLNHCFVILPFCQLAVLSINCLFSSCQLNIWPACFFVNLIFQLFPHCNLTFGQLAIFLITICSCWWKSQIDQMSSWQKSKLTKITIWQNYNIDESSWWNDKLTKPQVGKELMKNTIWQNEDIDEINWRNVQACSNYKKQSE
jgi:hypothetical protein